MEKIAIYTLTSELHNAEALDAASKKFLDAVFPDGNYVMKGPYLDEVKTYALDLFFVRTGGTEGIFLRALPTLQAMGVQYFPLLTSGTNNSLAASMEILSYLNQHGLEGEILHGSPEQIRAKIEELLKKPKGKAKSERLAKAAKARESLRGLRLGVLGKPSDWLIASEADYQAIYDKLGIEMVDIPMEVVCEWVSAVGLVEPGGIHGHILKEKKGQIVAAAPGAFGIHAALHQIAKDYKLDGFTIRCFDLLKAFGNTGCYALAAFNTDGILAGCEGDVPALLSMAISKAVSGKAGFMANPSRIDPESGKIVFAHCTVPFNMTDDVELDTHFESGLGIGIRGHIPEAPVTLLKVSGDLSRVFVAEGVIERNLHESNLCRTQIEVQLDDPTLAETYFLKNPIGNHHVVIPGRHAELILDYLAL